MSKASFEVIDGAAVAAVEELEGVVVVFVPFQFVSATLMLSDVVLS